MIATRINMGRVVEKVRATTEVIIPMKQGMITFSLAYISKILPPKDRPTIRVMAINAKKIPGLETPCRKAYRGKKAPRLPQMILIRKAMIDDGSTSRFKKGWFCVGSFITGMPWVFFNLRVMNRVHKDNAVQIKKRTVKPNWLMRSIPKYGARAKAKLYDKK